MIEAWARLQKEWDDFVRALTSEQPFRWLLTGGNIFYPLAAVFALSGIIPLLQGYTDGLHLFAEAAMLALAFVCLLYAGFSVPRSKG